MSTPEAIATVHDRTDRVTFACGRIDPVHLELAVKTHTPEEYQVAAAALREADLSILLGHNRIQEARATVEAIREVPDAHIHLIGPLQSNKINHALVCMDAIESLDSLTLTLKIDARTTGTLPALVEMNVLSEATEHGYAPADMSTLVDVVGASAHLQPVGLTTVGLSSLVEADMYVVYAQPRGIRGEAAAHLGIDEPNLALSMGMSRDLEWVIAEGAAIVRLGTMIFGARRV